MIGSTVTEAPDAPRAVEFLCDHMWCKRGDVIRQMHERDSAEAVYGYTHDYMRSLGSIYRNPAWVAEQGQTEEEKQTDLEEKIDHAYRLGYEDAKRDMLAKLEEMKK
jgi:hypothetical protein